MKIYSCNLTEVTQADFDKWFNAMSQSRCEAVMRLKVENKRRAKIAADRLCRLAVSEYCGILPDNISFSFNEHGKPYAEGSDVHFNVSHSGDLVVCAVSENEIGIDIEKIRPVNPEISERFACADEIDYIKISENGLLKIWTLKEAYFKCTGTGLGSDIKNVSFKIKKNEILCSENGFECSFHHIADGYICSVCRKI